MTSPRSRRSRPINPFDAVSASAQLGPRLGAAGRRIGEPAGLGRSRSRVASAKLAGSAGGARSELVELLEGEDALHALDLGGGAPRGRPAPRAAPAACAPAMSVSGESPTNSAFARRDIVAVAARARRSPGRASRRPTSADTTIVVHEPAEARARRAPRAASSPSSRRPRTRMPSSRSAAQRRRGVRVGRETAATSSSTSVRSSSPSAARPAGSCSRSTAAQRLRRSASEAASSALHVVGAVVGHLGQHRLASRPPRRPRCRAATAAPPAAAATAARARPACRARRTGRPRSRRPRGVRQGRAQAVVGAGAPRRSAAAARPPRRARGCRSGAPCPRAARAPPGPTAQAG